MLFHVFLCVNVSCVEKPVESVAKTNPANLQQENEFFQQEQPISSFLVCGIMSQFLIFVRSKQVSIVGSILTVECLKKLRFPGQMILIVCWSILLQALWSRQPQRIQKLGRLLELPQRWITLLPKRYRVCLNLWNLRRVRLRRLCTQEATCEGASCGSSHCAQGQSKAASAEGKEDAEVCSSEEDHHQEASTDHCSGEGRR